MRDEAGSSTGRGEASHSPMVLRVRVTDIFGIISLGTLIGVMGLLYNFFHNLGQDTEAKLIKSEERISERMDRIESRLDKCCESGR